MDFSYHILSLDFFSLEFSKAHNRCWTADRLSHRGVPHPERCPLCDQATETIDHLLILCVFTREFWFRFLSQVSLQSLSPQPTDLSFFDWWDRVSSATSDIILQGINSLIILGAWTIWTHCNRCVFDGAAPDIARALIIAGEERKLWSMAGARAISLLTAPHSESQVPSAGVGRPLIQTWACLYPKDQRVWWSLA